MAIPIWALLGFAAIVFALHVSGTGGGLVNILSVIIVIARVFQSLIHVCFMQNNAIVLTRFIFFFAQLVCFLVLIFLIIYRFWPVL